MITKTTKKLCCVAMASLLGLAGVGVAAFGANKAPLTSSAVVFNRDFDLVPLLCEVIDNSKTEQPVTVTYEGVVFEFSAKYVTVDKTNNVITIAPNGHLMNITAMNGLSSITIIGDDDVAGTSLLYGTVEDAKLDLRRGTKVEGFSSVSSLSNVTNFSLVSKASESASITKLQVAYTCDNESMERVDTSLVDVVTNFAFIGSGTQANPYRIETEEDFEYFRDLLDSGEEFSGEYIALINDIECVETPLSGIFKGDFNGNYNNIHLELDCEQGYSYYVGLFTTLMGATVHDLNLDGFVYASSTQYVGALAGTMGSEMGVDSCGLENVNCYAEVSGYKNVGGLVGYAYQDDSLSIKNCSYNGCYDETYDTYYGVTGASSVGGIAGYAGCDIIDCVVTSGEYEISATSSCGGIAGTASNSNIIGCIVEEDVMVNGYRIIGGIVGDYSPLSGTFTIDSCEFYGSMSGSISDVGGIAGSVGTSSHASPTITISNCYVGETTIYASYGDSDCANVGGIVGNMAIGSIELCSADCDIQGRKNTGGIVGNFYDDNGIISECVYYGYVFGYSSYTGGIAGYSTGKIYGSTICEGKVNTGNYSGGIVGYTTNVVEECINYESAIKGSDYTGGIAGYGTSSILTCSCDGSSVEGRGYVGGIAGRVSLSAAQSSQVESERVRINNCEFTGATTVSAEGTYVAGIVGYTKYVDITDCNTKNVVVSSSTKETNKFIGGIVGYAVYASWLYRNKCYSSATPGITDWSQGSGYVGYFYGAKSGSDVLTPTDKTDPNCNINRG